MTYPARATPLISVELLVLCAHTSTCLNDSEWSNPQSRVQLVQHRLLLDAIPDHEACIQPAKPPSQPTLSEKRMHIDSLGCTVLTAGLAAAGNLNLQSGNTKDGL